MCLGTPLEYKVQQFLGQFLDNKKKGKEVSFFGWLLRRWAVNIPPEEIVCLVGWVKHIFAHHNSSYTYTEVITKLGRLQPAIAAGNIITVGERKTIILVTTVTIIFRKHPKNGH